MSEAISKPLGAEGMIRMEGVHKWYGEFHVLKDINLNVRQGPVRPFGIGQVNDHPLPQPSGGAPAGSYRG
jgi:hypothetical protein